MKKNTKTITIIISIILVIVGATFAWFTWNSTNDTELTMNIGELVKIKFTTGNDISVNNIGPVLDYNDGEETTFSIRSKMDKTMEATIKLNITSIANELKVDTFKYKLFKSNTGSNYTEVVTNSFQDIVIGDNVIYTTTLNPSSTTYFKLIIYIDGTVENDVNMMGKSMAGTIEVDVRGSLVSERMDNSGANIPKLTTELVPVVYDESESSWVRANITDPNGDYKWYDYDEKKWANAVLVTDTNRDTYLDGEPGTVIPEQDVVAYYVWIPRYKYKVWNINKEVGVDSYDAYHTGIDIVFESGTNSTGTITCNPYDFTVLRGDGLNETCSGSNGDYYTHPAFNFGNDELEGFWVGKFHTTGSTGNLTIKPNIEPIIDLQVTEFANEIYNFIPNHNVVDSHMMKNMEWGAVAYLTNSEYGECNNGECSGIYYNNYLGYDNDYNTIHRTGCGTDYENWSYSICYPYNTTNGQLTSTTENIYGVYDMVTGMGTLVMGISSMEEGEYIVELDSDSIPLVNNDEKYFDKYRLFVSGYGIYDFELAKLGDAMGENAINYHNALYGSVTQSFWVYKDIERAVLYVDDNGIFINRGFDNSMFDIRIVYNQVNYYASARAVLAVY